MEHAPESPLSVLDRLVLAAGAALLAGYLEAGFLVGRNLIFRTITGSDPDALWMAPLAYLLVHLLILLLLEPIVRWRPNWWTPGRYLAPFVFLDGGFLILAVFKLRLHLAATILLAAGAAIQAVRWIDRPGRRRVAGLKRISFGLAAAWVPVALLAVGGPLLSERWALTGAARSRIIRTCC